MQMDGTGTSAPVTSATVVLNLSSNRNAISVSGVDSYAIGQLFRVSFF
jgi:hypothetical protein